MMGTNRRCKGSRGGPGSELDECWKVPRVRSKGARLHARDGTEPEPTDPGVEPTYRGTERWNGPVTVQRYANNVNASWTVIEQLQPERTAVPVEAGLSAQTSPKFIVHGH